MRYSIKNDRILTKEPFTLREAKFSIVSNTYIIITDSKKLVDSVSKPGFRQCESFPQVKWLRKLLTVEINHVILDLSKVYFRI